MPLCFVIDDEPLNREILCLQLGTFGFDAQEFSRPEDAADCKDHPDLVFTDLVFKNSDHDGFWYADLWKTRAGKKPYLVLMTATHDRRMRLRCLEHGVDNILHKPYETTELRDMIQVQRILAKNRHQRKPRFTRYKSTASDMTKSMTKLQSQMTMLNKARASLKAPVVDAEHKLQSPGRGHNGKSFTLGQPLRPAPPTTTSA